MPPDETESTLTITIRSGHIATIRSVIRLNQLTIESGAKIIITAYNKLKVTNDEGIDLDIQGTGSITGDGIFMLFKDELSEHQT